MRAATGRAIAELICDGQFRTLDLSELAPRRLLDGKPVIEKNVV